MKVVAQTGGVTATLSPTIRQLRDPDASVYRELRLQALREDPAAYLTSAEEYQVRTLEEVASRLVPTSERFTLGAFVNGELQGMATLVRSRSPRQRHRAEVFAVYVAPESRGSGLGHALMTELTRQARIMPGLAVLGLGVTETQTAARRLYERLGFVVWGVEDDVLRLHGRSLASLHLSLKL